MSVIGHIFCLTRCTKTWVLEEIRAGGVVEGYNEARRQPVVELKPKDVLKRKP